MAFIGSTAGTIKISVNRTQLQNAAFSYGDYINIFDPNAPSLSGSGMIFISSENVDAGNSRITCKLIDENSFPFPYVRSGSFLRKPSGSVQVACTGVSRNINTPSGLISVLDCITNDYNTPRHNIFNRNANGTVSSSNPFNSPMQNSIFANINVKWVNADTMLDASIGSHYSYTPLLIPITRRHAISFDPNSSSISSASFVNTNGSQSIVSISQSKNMYNAFEDAGLSLPVGISNELAEKIIIFNFNANIPSYIDPVKFCANQEVYSRARSLPIYAVTFTRKVAAVSAFVPSENGTVYTENLPISSRLQGVSQTEDFLNFCNSGESGHAFFAWDGEKSIFIGLSHNPVFYTGLGISGGVWDNNIIGFNSSGVLATQLSDCQNVLAVNLVGDKIGFESEKFLAMLRSNSAWQFPNDSTLSIENNLSEIYRNISSPQFLNPSGSRRRIIQKLR